MALTPPVQALVCTRETFPSTCLRCKYSFLLMLWTLRKSSTWTHKQLRTKGQLRGEMVLQVEYCGEGPSSVQRRPGVPLLRAICDVCASDATQESNFYSLAVMKCSSTGQPEKICPFSTRKKAHWWRLTHAGWRPAWRVRGRTRTTPGPWQKTVQIKVKDFFFETCASSVIVKDLQKNRHGLRATSSLVAS